MKKHIRLTALFLLSLMLLAGAAQAQNIKARMKARAPQIRTLKNEQAVGETNKGFLKAFKNKANSVVAEENNDRKQVYAAIARQQGASPTFVGERRAAQIRQRATSGDMLQGKDGSWYQKQ